MNPCGRFGCAPDTRAQKQALRLRWRGCFWKASWRSGPKLMAALHAGHSLAPGTLSRPQQTHSFTQSVIQQMFGCPLYARPWGFSRESARLPGTWARAVARMMEGVGTGNEKEHVMCAVEKPLSKESGSWSTGREVPLLSTFTHVKSTESRQTVRGLCFPMPLFGGLLQRAGQKRGERLLQAEGTACAKAGSCWGRRRLWESRERWTGSGPGPGWPGGGLADKDAESPGLGAGLAAWEV